MTKLLLVEDDKNLREIYTTRLKAENYDILSAGDGEEALALAIKERPDLIVSDVMMPKISGFDMLDILRSTTETKDIKVIMMTALSSEDQRTRGEQLGANKYLVKSQVGIEDVVRAVHEVLGDAPVASGNAFATPAASAASAAPAAQPAQQAPAPTPEPTPMPAPAPAEPSAPAPTPTEPAAAPSAPATPAPTMQPPAPAAPVTAPAAPIEPTAPAPAAPADTTPAPAAPAALAPQAPQAPAPAPAAGAPAPAPAVEPFSLPQPTAPFSTDRPAGLADRIIQPIEKPADASEPLADRMDKELSGDPSTSPFASTPAPEPDMSTENPVGDSQGLEFEETPRPGETPPAAPAPAAPQQPPAV